METRGLSVAQGSALTLGAVLGTGVISLPALAASAAGPASLVAWLALIVLSVPLATTFATLGARHPDGGGVATYARMAFGPHVATMVGWTFYLTIGIGAPVAAGFAGSYVADAVGAGRSVALGVVAAIVVVVSVLNWFGIQVSGRVQLVAALVLLALTGLHALGPLLFAAAGLTWSLLRPAPPADLSEPGVELSQTGADLPLSAALDAEN